MRKKRLIVLLVIVTLWGTLTAQGAELKAGYVDLQEIFQKTGLSSAFMEQLRKEQGILRKSEQEVAELREKLEAQRSILKPEELKKQEKLLQERLLELRKSATEAEAKLGEIKTQNFAAIKETVSKVALKEGLDIVLEKGVIIFCANPVDLTQKVIDKYKDGGSRTAPTMRGK